MKKGNDNAGIAISIALTILAFFIGLFGIAVLIGVGEAANNAIAAFAAVSFPFALLAGFLSWIAPRARWTIAIAMSAPVAILCLMSASMGTFYVPGAIWTVLLTCVGANLGGRLRLSGSGTQGTPTS